MNDGRIACHQQTYGVVRVRDGVFEEGLIQIAERVPHGAHDVLGHDIGEGREVVNIELSKDVRQGAGPGFTNQGLTNDVVDFEQCLGGLPGLGLAPDGEAGIPRQ